MFVPLLGAGGIMFLGCLICPFGIHACIPKVCKHDILYTTLGNFAKFAILGIGDKCELI